MRGSREPIPPGVQLSAQRSLLLVLGDSLPYPRPDIKVELAQTWPSILARAGIFDYVWFQPSGGNSIQEVEKGLRNALAYLDSNVKLVVIVSQGIVDATPRPLPKALGKLYAPFDALIQLRFGKKASIKRLRFAYLVWGRPNTPIRKFRRVVREVGKIISSLDDSMLVWLEINSPGPNMKKIVGDFSVEPWNQILRDELRGPGIRTLRVNLDRLHPDGHHLTISNHLQIAKELERLLSLESI